MSFCGYSDGLVSDSSMLALDGWMITGPSGPHEVLEWFPLVYKIVFWGECIERHDFRPHCMESTSMILAPWVDADAYVVKQLL